MKRITITYDVKDRDNVTGETCMDITVSDEIADRLIQPFPDSAAVEEIEKAVAPLESLKGRSYIKGSITDIREAE